jgi:Zn-dependent oligopeptidase
VKNSDGLREAIAEVQDDNVRLGNRFSESRQLYDAFARMQNSTNLTEVQARIVEGVLLTGQQGGVTLQVRSRRSKHCMSACATPVSIRG